MNVNVKMMMRQQREMRASKLQEQFKKMYGYKLNEENEVVIDPVPAENVRFVFKKALEYMEEPPKELVERIIELQKRRDGVRLSYEQAKKKVPYRTVLNYLAKEVEVKNMAFELSEQAHTVELLREIFSKPFNVFDVGKIEVDYKQRNGSHIEQMLWHKRINRMFDSAYCTGEIAFCKSFSKDSPYEISQEDIIRVPDYFDPIISPELFDKVQKKCQERYLFAEKEQAR
ncbi:recombinase family protein [Anaerofustis stercorihominis]|uniref:recombinase family protein n=1 Tax=Anaerofustis stercorihominis TaxID=214853 RepID=UPI00210E37C6|nr:recombinase family protein [Anaerofustis stercorihominis]MCQ4794146.1 recombinase family protein [Anaerofustis stercorihominis]